MAGKARRREPASVLPKGSRCRRRPSPRRYVVLLFRRRGTRSFLARRYKLAPRLPRPTPHHTSRTCKKQSTLTHAKKTNPPTKRKEKCQKPRRPPCSRRRRRTREGTMVARTLALL